MTDGGVRIVCLGEILIDFVSTVSGVDLAGAPSFEKAAGGAPANVAVGVARLGVSAAFIGKVGTDPFGQFLIATMQNFGVNVSGMAKDAEARTTLAFVSNGADGERNFVFFRNPGADECLNIGDLKEDLIRQADIFHFGSISLTGQPARATTLHAAGVAKAAGKLVCFDPNLRLNLWPDSATARHAIADGAQFADIIKVSEEELAWLPPGLTPKLMLVTRGAGGSEWRTAPGRAVVPGFPVDAIDTTGAGDAFLAAMLAQLAERPEIMDDAAALTLACRFANAAGALATMKRGAIPSLPDREAVEKFIAAAVQ